MKMFKSLKNQLLFYFFIANFTVLFVFSIFIFSTAQKGAENTLDAQLKIISLDAIADLLDGVEYVNAKEIASELEKEFTIEPLDVKIIYYDKLKKKIEHISVSSNEKLFEVALNEMGHLFSIYYFDKKNYRISSMLLLENSEKKVFFQTATKKVFSSKYLDQLLLNLLIAVPLILFLLLVVANYLLKKSLEPVKDTILQVNEISVNNLSASLSTQDSPFEIRELINTFNNLLFRLKETFERISTFSSDASHELKTPLTVIRGEAEIGLRKDRTIDEYKNILENILDESIKVQETIDQLFFLTKKDTSELKSNFQDIYLDELLSEVISEIEPFAHKKNLHIELKKVTPITVFANEVLLKTVISNIIRNAINYSENDNEISIYLYKEEQNYILKIQDNGCGIKKEDLLLIFDRFYRVDRSRSRKDAGTGLGLSIVKMICDIHNFDIEIKSTVAVGTSVSIKIPKVISKEL